MFILDITDFRLPYQEIANIIQSRKGTPQLACLRLGWSARNFTAFFETANCAILQPAFLGLQNPWQNIWPTPWHCKENGSLEAVLFGWGNCGGCPISFTFTL